MNFTLLILFIALCALAYHPINAIIQTIYIVILIAMGLDDGKIYYTNPRDKHRQLILPSMGTWHSIFAQPLTWISVIANIYFWWIRLPDLLLSPIPQFKVLIVGIIFFTPYWLPVQLMALGRIFKAFTEYKMLTGVSR